MIAHFYHRNPSTSSAARYRVPTFQPRLAEGMVRYYLAQGRVVGFGQQMVTALLARKDVGAETPPPPARVYYGPDAAEFRAVRSRMESDWQPALPRTLEVDACQLPAIWDADLLHGERSSPRPEAYILCEISREV